jgi:hypothetical protein
MPIEREQETFASVRMVPPEFITFLHQARQLRLMAKSCPDEARHYKSACRFWLAMAHQAQGPPLP